MVLVKEMVKEEKSDLYEVKGDGEGKTTRNKGDLGEKVDS